MAEFASASERQAMKAARIGLLAASAPKEEYQAISIGRLIDMAKSIEEQVRRVRDSTCETADRLLGPQDQKACGEIHPMPPGELAILEDVLGQIRSAAYQAQDEANRLSAL